MVGGYAVNDTIEAVVVAAMQEEAEPFFEGIGATNAVSVEVPFGEAWHVNFDERDVVVLRSGVGLVNTAVAATHALTAFKPQVLLSAGSAGGLANGLFIGDVIVGTSYSYASADAQAFGYELGQIPGMPLAYEADEALLQAALAAKHTANQTSLTIRAGKILSSDVFVDARNADRIRADFPGALAADMESTALAQVAYLHGVPFLAVRGISDLCGQDAGEDFHFSIEEVARRSAHVLRHVITTLPHD